MGDVVLFASVSVDGFSAGPRGEVSRLHRWMDDASRRAARGDEDEFVRAFETAGAVVIGRRTYDSGREPWGEEEVFRVPVFVVTHEELAPVAANGTVFTFVGGTPQEVLARARDAANGGDVVIMGSADVGQQFLRAALVDRILLHRVPVLLGAGTRLFSDLPQPLELTPTVVRTHPEVTLTGYLVDGTRPPDRVT